jgi:hypothetical protein
MLEERSDGNVVTPEPAQESGISGFLRRLFGSKAPIGTVAHPSRLPTAARKLRESLASTAPVCCLSAGGAQALERGVVAQRRVRPARLLFLAEPLLFLGVVDEKRQHHTQHRRAIPLDPEHVPAALRVLEAAFALPVQERLAACGIENGIPGFSGQFVGIVPGAQWEVRPFQRKSSKGREHQKALLIIAAFACSEAERLRWRVYVRQQERTLDCPQTDAARFLTPELRCLQTLLTIIEADADLPDERNLRADGAFELRCNNVLLPSLLGEADGPDDTFLPATATGWWVGLRTHAVPIDIEASRAAFYEFLRRREATLRRNFDGTCADVATSLTTYWGDNVGLPSADEAAVHLWTRAELRAALCMRRRHRDLVAPYENEQVKR